MAVYQDKAKDRIKRSIKRLQRIIAKGKEEKFNEADTRKIVSDVLTKMLGWDTYENITAEQMISSQYADYVLKADGDELAVIEVKAITVKLKEAHLMQARTYAVNNGVDWAALTNGDVWKLYHVDNSGKVPKVTLVFSLALTDPDMKPAEKTALMYLLSKEAYKKHEVADYYERRVALSGENLASHILSDDVLNKLRLSIKRGNGQNLANGDIAEALVKRLFSPEAVTDDVCKRVAKLKRQ